MDEYIVMEFLQSGYVLERFMPTLGNYIREGNFIEEPATYLKRLQRIFGTVEFGSKKVLKNRFVLVSVTGKDET